MVDKQDTFLPAETIPASIEYHVFRISKRSRVIYMTFLCILLISLASLPFIYVDLSVSAPAWVHAGIEHQTLYTPSTGRVVFSRIKAGTQLDKGDTLLIIDTRAKEARLNMLLFQQSENALAINDLRTLLRIRAGSLTNNRISLKLPSYFSEHLHFSRQYQSQQMVVQKASNDHQRMRRLFLNDVVPATEYEATRHALQQETALKESMLLQQHEKWQHELSLRIVERERIKADMDQLQEEIDRCYLLAPLNSTIILSTDVQAGSQITANQPIAELSPEGELFVTAKVSPTDIGYLYTGQEVRVAVDAYNHNHWGMIQASIDDISDDIIADPSSGFPYYRVRCRLQSDSLVHKNGSVGWLRKGMTANCHMIKTRKSLFQLLTKTIDELFNPTHHHKNQRHRDRV